MSEIILSPLLISNNIRANTTSSVFIETPSLKLLCYLNGPYYSTNVNFNENKMLINLKIKIPEYIDNPSLKRDVTVTEDKLKNILNKHLLITKHPRTKLDIVIEIYEINCDYFPYALMASSICCNYANIEQRGILTSCTLTIDNENNIIPEPKLNELNKKNPKFTICYNIALNETLAFFQEGSCNDEVLKKVIAYSMKICDEYHKFILKKL